MSKYEIVELDSGEYAVRKKPGFFGRLFGVYKYYSLNLFKTEYLSPTVFTRTRSLMKAKALVEELEQIDYNSRPRKFKRVVDDV